MFNEDFKKHLEKFSTAPFLFIGSGISRRYINMETWYALLKNLNSTLQLPKPFEYYVSNSNSNLPMVASLMGKDFNEIWWSDEYFTNSRNLYGEHAKSPYSPFKYEITKFIEGKALNVSDGLKAEFNLLKKVNIDGVITTNWDLLIETLFPEFKKFIGQEELIFSELYSVGEIYKIHGCITNAESLVLTDEDYKNFHERNTYLAAKLLTIFIEHPVIFLGYSLDDRNIQQILKSIIKCLTKEKIENLKDRLIFCQWTPSTADTTFIDSTLLISDTVIPIKLIQVSNYSDIYSVLANLKKRLPIKVLRQMKGMIYEFVKTSNPTSKVFVSDNLELLEKEKEVEFVYGIGLRDKFSEVGIKGITVQDLHRDIIIDNKWNARNISTLYLPTLANNKYVPYFKYLSQGKFLNGDGKIDPDIDVKEFSPIFIKKVNSISIEFFYPAQSYRNKKDEINRKYQSFLELKEDLEQNEDKNIFHILMFTPLLDVEKINLRDLHKFLKSNLDKLVESKYGTHYRKLICLYDYLKYSQKKE